jgi:hypothetical protein
MDQLLPSFLYGLMVYGLFCPMYLNTKAAIEFIRSRVLPFFLRRSLVDRECTLAPRASNGGDGDGARQGSGW